MPAFITASAFSVATLICLAFLACFVAMLSSACAEDTDLVTDTDTMIHGGTYPGGTGDLSGWDITAGDLDGDGVQDLLISAVYGDGPDDTRWSTMDLYLLLGRERGAWDPEISGPDSADVIFYGGYNLLNEDSNFPGWDLACGDIDGDGFDDLAFSAPHTDGPAGDRNATGAVYVYYGRPRGEWLPVYDTMGEVGPAADIEIYGADENDSIGGRDMSGSHGANVSKSLALEDITGDGKADIIFGAIYADGENNAVNSCGDVYIVFGNTREALTELITVNPSDPGRHADVAIYGGADADFFGFSIAVGDVDGDTIGDLLAGALFSDGPASRFRNSCGDAWVFFGREAGQWNDAYNISEGEYDRWIQGRAENGHAPYRLAAGDIDGDGRDDIVLSTPHNRVPVRAKAGEHVILFGRERTAWPEFLDLASDYDVWFQGRDNCDVWGTVNVERFEIGCDAVLGDVNDDGRADLLLGAKFGDSVANSRANAGEAILILGRNQEDFSAVYDLRLDPGIIEANIWGAETGVTGDGYHYDAAGHSVLLVDLTGDGRSDIVLAAPFADGPGNSIPEAGETYVIFSDDASGIATGVFNPGTMRLVLGPNPSPGWVRGSFTLAHSRAVEVEIVDVAGRLVRTLYCGAAPAGATELVWDGCDRTGRQVASGIYLARLHACAQGTVVTRMVMAR
jgi:hypothetical protein